jgi:hypothetical protein
LILLGYPVRLLHFVYVNAYGWLYALITFIYFIIDPKNNIIYEKNDYNQPLQIFSAYFFLTILVFAMQTFHFLAYQLKVSIRESYLLKCNNNTIIINNTNNNNQNINLNDHENNINVIVSQ